MRAYLPEGVPNYVTKEGLEVLKEELKNLEAERVKAGDNYIMVNFLDASIKLLVDRINSATHRQVVDREEGGRHHRFERLGKDNCRRGVV